ncbi:hypothetical protein P5673_031786 [Acropora cervicornis]|uniref:Uncharacterized protein n=1 Tax=Acropora cervicornis TaxID=6130 RepID=A0AAD9USA3_ACRCE|nr:hypothetical protein P5673_031786 [Acropora cervicornis]
MSQFDTEKFMSEPYKDPFYVLKEDELISLAKHLKLEIQNIMVEHLVTLKVFEGTVLETVETSDLELKKLQLQLEFKTLEMQERLEMEEKQSQEREQRQVEREKEERERQERLEEKERQERLEEKE